MTPQNSSCIPSQTSGVCVVSVTVPDAWFTHVEALNASLNGGDNGFGGFNVSAAYGLTTMYNAGELANAATVYPGSTFTADAATTDGLMIGRLPEHELHEGDTFSVPVTAQVFRVIETFRLLVFVGPELEVLDFSVDERVWTGAFGSTPDGRNLSASYILSDSGSAPGGIVSDEQVLGTVRVRVRAGSTSAGAKVAASVGSATLVLSDVSVSAIGWEL